VLTVCRYKGKSACSGVIILLAMVFLLLLSILAGTSMQASILEFRMSGNQLFHEEAFQKAAALVSAISDNTNNFPVDLPEASAVCDVGNTSAYCVRGQVVAIPTSVGFANDEIELAYTVERMAPLIFPGLPLRTGQHAVSSNLAFHAAIFEIHVEVDGRDLGLGHARVVQGIAKLVAAAPGKSAE